jgi:hypothetical protein
MDENIKKSIETHGEHETVRRIIESRADIIEEGRKLRKELEDNGRWETLTLNHIDDIFAYIEERSPAMYGKMNVKGSNTYRMKFVHAGTLYTINRDCGYGRTSPHRISILREDVAVI